MTGILLLLRYLSVARSACWPGRDAVNRIFLTLIAYIVMFISLAGCSLRYMADDPPAPGFVYQNVDRKPITMKVVDQRDSVQYMVGISGLQRVALTLENLNDPVSWIANGLVKEFNARGVPLQLAAKESSAPADLTLTVRKYQLINHRASGFSAWESYNVFLGQVTMGSKSCSIPSFFFNSKIPVWSMDEVQKPCISDPMAVVVKDVASKINQCLFGYGVSNDDLQKLTTAALSTVKADSPTACFPLIDLGGTNNPAAMETLKTFAGHGDSFVHNCAVSAIGTLGAQNEFAFLEGRFNYFAANDRVMPLKAIGDIGSSQAQNFLRQVQAGELYREENGVRYCTDLYLSR